MKPEVLFRTVLCSPAGEETSGCVSVPSQLTDAMKHDISMDSVAPYPSNVFCFGLNVTHRLREGYPCPTAFKLDAESAILVSLFYLDFLTFFGTFTVAALMALLAVQKQETAPEQRTSAQYLDFPGLIIGNRVNSPTRAGVTWALLTRGRLEKR
ncbi:hypothetical protein [Thermoanaerobaculum aquaticum]|uniref:hypothetical protein n=1 Tax=Thermoanaerobaculum aquaticum TaxID=1312852 RepID=UPI001268B25E|nr:hypothetical protein [Thermoanaerobaculum aquaticum]